MSKLVAGVANASLVQDISTLLFVLCHWNELLFCVLAKLVMLLVTFRAEEVHLTVTRNLPLPFLTSCNLDHHLDHPCTTQGIKSGMICTNCAWTVQTVPCTFSVLPYQATQEGFTHFFPSQRLPNLIQPLPVAPDIRDRPAPGSRSERHLQSISRSRLRHPHLKTS